MARRARILEVILAALLLSMRAGAEPDNRTASTLFDQAVQELKAGNHDQACWLLSESYQRDKNPGTLFTLAECEAFRERYATAMRHYADYLAAYARMAPNKKAAQLQRPEVAKEQLSQIELRVPRLSLILPKSVPAGTRVELDAAPVSRLGARAGLPVDPGEHEVTIYAAGREPAIQRIQIETGEHKTLRLHFASDAPRDVPAAKPWQTYAALGAGGAGIVVGLVAGALALSEKSTVEDNCVGDRCNAEGKAAADRGQTFGLISTAGFVVGVAGVGLGAALWVRETPAAEEKAAASSRAKPPDSARRQQARGWQLRFRGTSKGIGTIAAVEGTW